jgi:hypothetical protein
VTGNRQGQSVGIRPVGVSDQVSAYFSVHGRREFGSVALTTICDGRKMSARRSPDPSVKDPAWYEKLRTEGNSRDKAARIVKVAAASSLRKVSKKGGRSASCDDWSKTELRRKAKQVGTDGRSKMSKKRLFQALRRH